MDRSVDSIHGLLLHTYPKECLKATQGRSLCAVLLPPRIPTEAFLGAILLRLHYGVEMSQYSTYWCFRVSLLTKEPWHLELSWGAVIMWNHVSHLLMKTACLNMSSRLHIILNSLEKEIQFSRCDSEWRLLQHPDTDKSGWGFYPLKLAVLAVSVRLFVFHPPHHTCIQQQQLISYFKEVMPVDDPRLYPTMDGCTIL